MGETSNTKDKTVCITGIGLLSSLGEGTEAHWQALQSAQSQNVDEESYSPYPVHALAQPDWSQQISRRDMRQMEPWQQIGTYAAGLALEDAGAKGDEELCGRMDMIVAAGGGERDLEVDASVMAQARDTNDIDALLAERLSNDLRPTLFLAQLSNLLAGNISIVHKVTGSSRTFMGEEGAGISAIQTAHARIASGQSDIVLVGGGYNGERLDMLLLFGLGGYALKDKLAPVWERSGDNSGFALGSIGAFLVLESAEHAAARGARSYATLSKVAAAHGSRDETLTLERMTDALDNLGTLQNVAVLSGATGVEGVTALEQGFLNEKLPDAPIRGMGTVTGHGMETQFPLGVALSALALSKGAFYPPFSSSEKAAQNTPGGVVVTTLGHHRAEGFALVTPTTEANET